MLSRTTLPYEKVAIVPTTLKVPIHQVPLETTNSAFRLCVQRAGGMPAGLSFDPPVFTKQEDTHVLRVRFHGPAESYIDDNQRVLACMSTLWDAFIHLFIQQNTGMIVG